MVRCGRLYFPTPDGKNHYDSLMMIANQKFERKLYIGSWKKTCELSANVLKDC